MSWQQHAGCREVDPEMFFPTAETGPDRAAAVAAAKTVCAGCPIRARCLEYALEHLAHGIAGGMDEGERRALRRFRARAEAPAVAS